MLKIEGSANAELERIAEADLARLCYTCGICVGDCPAARFSDDFNPRQIFLKVCLGIEEGLVGEDSPIWKCTTCYTCYERCPAGVKPLDVILALRNLSFRRGSCPEAIKAIRSSVLSRGLVGAPTQRIKDLREKMGLPDVPDEDAGSELEGLIGEA
jgi:heterodisulfide reductase subunit C